MRRAIVGGEVHLFRVSMQAGQALTVLTRSRDLNLRQGLKSLDGQTLVESNTIRPHSAAVPLVWIADAPATYRLEVRCAARTCKKAPYELRVMLAQAQAEDRKRLAMQTIWLVELKALGMKGRWQELLEKCGAALSLARELGDRRMEARFLSLMGRAHTSLGNGRAALGFFQQAHSLHRDAGPRAQADSLYDLGEVYTDLGEYQNGLDHFQRARSQSRSVGYRGGEAAALAGLGYLYDQLGEYQAAARFYREAAAARAGEGNRFSEAEALALGADAADAAGDPAAALAQYEKLLTLMSELGHGGAEATVLLNMGAVHLRVNQPHTALDCFKRGLERVRAEGDPRNESIALWMLGDAYRALGQADSAWQHYEQAASLASAQEYGPAQTGSLVGMAYLERDRGHLTEARQLMATVTDRLEAARPTLRSEELRLPYAALTREAYDLSVDVLMRLHVQHPEQGLDRTAFEVSERGQARALLQTLQDARVDTSAGSASLAQPTPLGAAEIQALLDRDTVLVEYHLGADQSYAWVATPETLVSVPLPRESEVQERARRFHELLIERNRRGAATAVARRRQLQRAEVELSQAGRELSETILGPLPSPPGRRLVIVADGALHYVPFAALPLPGSWSAGEAPLVTRYEIGNLPSASVVAFQRSQQPSRQRPTREIAVFADPVFDRQDGRVRHRGRSQLTMAAGPLPRLEYTRVLADHVLGGLPSASVLKATDFGASRAAALSPELAQYRTVVFATHGLLDTRYPERSSIALSMVNEQGQPQDGFLRLRDVYHLQLNADLVVLGACETGLGKQIRGEGLVGLSRGFMHAGATRVLASLWKVEEEATMALLEEFLRLVHAEGRSHPAALREAQLRVSRDPRWRSPYYWAGFVLQGEWRS